METILPLEEYEASPDFKALAPDDKDKFYSNYYSTAQEEAKSEDDYNKILKYRADRQQSALYLNYRSTYPDDTQIDLEKIKSDKFLAALYQKVQSDYAQLNYNQNSKPSTVSADDMQDSKRSFTYKPYQYGEQQGYTVKYPDGTIESIKGIGDESQLTDYLRKNRLNKFDGRREGFFDDINSMADTEFDSIYDKIRKTDSGLQGKWNGIRARYSSMMQGYDLMGIIDDEKYLNIPIDFQTQLAQLDKERAATTNPDKIEDIDRRISAAAETAARMKSYTPEHRAQSLADNEEIRNKLVDKYKDLAKEMMDAQSIRGDRVMQQYQDHIAATIKDKSGDFSTFTDYFKENKSDFLPYVTAVATSSLPDMVAIMGAATATGVVTGGNVVAAGAAAGSVGYAMEYTGTLLSEMQNRAAVEGKKLYDPGVIASYVDDKPFLDNVEGKAMVRASIIAVTDAVIGGSAEKIAHSVTGNLKRASLALGIDMVSGAGGESAAQYATEQKFNFTEILNEGFGEIGGAPVTVVRGHFNEKAKAAKEAKTLAEAQSNASDVVGAAAYESKKRLEQQARLDAMKAKFDSQQGDNSQSTDKSAPVATKTEQQLYDESFAPSVAKPTEEPVTPAIAQDKVEPIAPPDKTEPPITPVAPDPVVNSTDAKVESPVSPKVISDNSQSTDKSAPVATKTEQQLYDESFAPSVAKPTEEPVTPAIVQDKVESPVPLAAEQPSTVESEQPPTNSDGQLIPFAKPPKKGNTVTRKDGMRGDIISESNGMLSVEWNDGTASEILEADLKSRSKQSQAQLGNNVEVSVGDRIGDHQTITVTTFDKNGNSRQIYQSRNIANVSEDTFQRELDAANKIAEKHAKENNLSGYDYNTPNNKKRVSVSKLATSAQDKAESPITHDPVVNSTETKVESPLLPEVIANNTQLTEKAPGMLYKALNWFYGSLLGRDLSKTEKGRNRIEAARLLQNMLNGTVFSLLADTNSYDRVIAQVINSNYDSQSRGNLMSLFGLTPNDSKARVLTNVLGNFWTVNKESDATKKSFNESHMAKGLIMSEIIDAAYRKLANVDSIYDMKLGDLNEISQKDIFFAMTPDDLVLGEDGTWSVQSQAYNMSNEESVKRFNAQFFAKRVRAPGFDATLNNKYNEASALQRPGIHVLKLTDIKGTPEQQAKHVFERMGKNGFMVKDAAGDNGRNIYHSYHLDENSLANLIKNAGVNNNANLDDIYFETVVFKRNNTPGFNEHRVHLYVDSEGNAHVFRNLTFNKNDTYYSHDREAIAGNPEYDTHILIPSDASDPKIRALQKFAQEAMSGKGFFDMVFGLDVGETQDSSGQDSNFVFEANALTYGMSGWLGNPIAMSEIISEMTGKPSVLAGLYDLAKTGLSKSELSDIKSKIDQGMPAEHAAHPEYYDAINKGMALFNKYLPSAKWLSAMQNLYKMPIKFFTSLYNAIKNAFKGSVDKRFAAQQDPTARRSQSTETVASESSRLLTPDKGGMKLGDYIKRVLAHPSITESQKAVLNYILKSKPNALQLTTVDVGKTNLGFNYFSTGKNRIGLVTNGLNPRIAVHEIIHAVTSDTIEANLLRAHLMLDQVNDINYNDTKSLYKVYQHIVDPSNEKALLEAGVHKDFIELTKTYVKFVSDLGLWGEDTKMGGGVTSYEHQAKNPKIPYAATNIDEFVTETLTKEDFQKKLSQLPSTLGNNSRSLYSRVMQSISRLLSIPFKYGNTLLHQAVSQSLSIIDAPSTKVNSMYSTQTVDGTWVLRPSSPESDITYVNGKPYISSDVKDTSNSKSVTDTESQQEANESQADKESINSRISQLKDNASELTQEAQDKLKAIDPTPENLPRMREVVIDDLNAKVEQEKPDSQYEMTEKRQEYINTLNSNKSLALSSLGEWINDSRLTDGMVDILLDSVDYVMDQSEDPSNLSTNKIKYITNVLQSMSDGGPPIGFKHIAPKLFIDRQVALFNQMKQNNLSPSGKQRVHIQAPAGSWRREIVFGAFQGGVGSSMQQASEISYMGLSEAGHKFIRDMMGFYKDNIDLQNLEERAVKDDFYNHVKAQFPDGGLQQLNAKRIGVVGRLTQYDSLKTEDPKSQILSRLNQLISGIDVEKEYSKDDGEASNLAVNQILNGTDLATYPDHNAIISFLESRLTPAEKSVLDKLRDIGKQYMPALQTVKAITKNTVLQQFENYIHDANIHPVTKETEESMLKAFTSMSDILHDRKGINTSEKDTYAELDITAIADRQIRSSTYEKHTGMQRYMLANALSAGSQLTDLLDSDTNQIRKPVTNRLRTLLASYHNAMTTSQHTFTGILGLVDASMNLIVGTKIVGVNAFIKNAVSSSVARFSLKALSNQALVNSMTYDTHMSEINAYLKANYPTQYNRAGEYDIIEGSKDRHSIASKAKRNIDIGHSPFAAAMRTLPGAPRQMLQTINDTVMTKLSHASNGLPEKHAAFAMFTAALVHYMQQNGTVTDMADFLARKPVDRRAANDASAFVDNALGYSADKASKGTYWNASTATKKILSKAYSVFRQQSTGLALDFQNNIQKAVRLTATGNAKEGKNAMTLAMTSLANSMSFRALTIALSGSMMWGGLDRFFNASDDEDKKKALLEAKRKYTENANRNNMRDFMSESLLMLAPVATSAMFVEAATAGMLDANKLVVGWSPKGFDAERKEDIKIQLEDIRGQIAKIEKAARIKVDRNLNTQAEDDEIDKLSTIENQLSEKFKFKYFPSQSDKALLSTFGSYGIAQEYINDTIGTMIGDDLDTEKKQRLMQSFDNEYSYHDPLAGEGYGLSQVNDMLGYARKLVPSEWMNKKPTDNYPNSLFWMEYLKAGQNPKVVIERARLSLAEDALNKKMAAERRAARIESRWADKYRK